MSPAKKQILLADDDRLTRDLMAHALRESGYEVIEAADGYEAYSQVQVHEPSVVLLDINMPGMNGLEFLDKLRRIPRRKDVPVIMITASSDKDEVLRAANLGIDDYVLKTNFSIDDLLDKIEKYMLDEDDLPGDLE
jgi:CheY-like chemotaxis protein